MRVEIAQQAHALETVDARVPGGRQDQYAAALGGFQFLEFEDPSVQATRLEPPAACVRDLEHHLVLCYAGASRFSGRTIANVMGRYEAGEPRITAALDGLRSCAFAMRDALARGDVAAVGEVLAEDWSRMKELGPELETAAMRTLEEAAVRAGVKAWKACGSAAGGCLMFLAPPGEEPAVAEALRQAGGTILRYTFDVTGVEAWTSQER